MKVGLVGEAPSDTSAIASLLIKEFPHVEFFPLLRKIHGSSLESQKVKRFLRIEFEEKKPSIVIFLRDLDALENDIEAIKRRKSYFKDFNTVVDKSGIFLLNIYEIEALILSDIGVFNHFFGTDLQPIDDVMLVPEPKEFLKSHSKHYDESFNVELFSKLDFEIVHQNCRYFRSFIFRFKRNMQLIA